MYINFFKRINSKKLAEYIKKQHICNIHTLVTRETDP